MFLVLSIVSASSYSQTEPKYSIHFLLPDGYVGAFKLVLDKETGSEMTLENGRYILDIPRSGILKIKSFRPFAGLHEMSAFYKNGTRIPYDPSGSLMPKSIAFRKVWVVIRGFDGNGDMVSPTVWTYIIGTKQQAARLKRVLERRRRA
jgi:hypothetical protein